jgi:biopolymer transport protein ExbB
MKPLVDFLRQGGPVMLAILALSVVLYSRCCRMLLSLWRARRDLGRAGGWDASRIALIQRMRDDARDSFRQQRISLAAMVAAAPLLGLLGTVSGMVKTFEGLASKGNGESMGDLARGISQVLVATESGLAVAIPALVVIYGIHSGVRRYVKVLDRLEAAARRGGAP